MPVRLRQKLVKGWKESENNRFGYCLVIQFVDTKTNKVLFEYAGFLKDKSFWYDYFQSMEELDKKHKAYIEWIKKNLDKNFIVGKGGGDVL